MHTPYDVRQNNERCLVAGVIGTLFVFALAGFAFCSWNHIMPQAAFLGLGTVFFAFTFSITWDGRLRE